jgi:TonB family protein
LLKVEVLLDHPCASLEEATSILHHVFAMTDEDLLDSVPIYWKPFVAKRAGLRWKEPAANARLIAGSLKESDLPTPGVTPPKATDTPIPEFTELARLHRFQGIVELSVVIDAHGRVELPRIKRPVGMGLDEQAIEVVKRWRFKPARKNGQPVNAEMTLVIAFHLR